MDEPQDTTQSQTQMINYSEIVKDTLSRIDQIKKQLGEYKDMTNALFENDSTYQAHSEAVKKAQETRNKTKKEILKLPQAQDLQNKVLDLKDQLKTLQQDLSDYLEQYRETTGARQIENQYGDVLDIVYTARLIKR